VVRTGDDRLGETLDARRSRGTVDPVVNAVTESIRARSGTQSTAEPAGGEAAPEVVQKTRLYAGAIGQATAQLAETRLSFESQPRNIAIFLRRATKELIEPFEMLRDWLVAQYGVRIFVDPAAAEELVPGEATWTPEQRPHLSDMIDLIITMGGDGTLLFVSSLFERSVPPVVAFNFGSLGFLTSWDFGDFRSSLTRIFEQQSHLNLRRRLHVTVVQFDEGGKPSQVSEYQVLNEVVVDRGSSPYMAGIDAYVDSQYCTTVAADGVILSTPTGSTAYSLSAGGPMVHPAVTGVLFTPICPHSLSFRPVVFPDRSVVRLQLPESARGEGQVTLDGRVGPTLRPGDCVVVSISAFPLPCVAPLSDTHTWLASLASVLHWNDRRKQESLTSASYTETIAAARRAGKAWEAAEEEVEEGDEAETSERRGERRRGTRRDRDRLSPVPPRRPRHRRRAAAMEQAPELACAETIDDIESFMRNA
jgi:NAD+ kinase